MRAWPVGGDGARPDSTEVGESCWNGTAGGMPVGDSGVSCWQDTTMGLEAISAVTAVTGIPNALPGPGLHRWPCASPAASVWLRTQCAMGGLRGT